MSVERRCCYIQSNVSIDHTDWTSPILLRPSGHFFCLFFLFFITTVYLNDHQTRLLNEKHITVSHSCNFPSSCLPLISPCVLLFSCYTQNFCFDRYQFTIFKSFLAMFVLRNQSLSSNLTSKVFSRIFIFFSQCLTDHLSFPPSTIFSNNGQSMLHERIEIS
jgi:hypothetical protein